MGDTHDAPAVIGLDRNHETIVAHRHQFVLDRFRELWREIRSDHRPVIAPYPERTPPKPWK